MAERRDILGPGSIVVARWRARSESGYIARPTLLVRRVGPRDREVWMAFGLTASPNYGDGEPRLVLLDWEASGLDGPAYLISPRPLPLEIAHTAGAHIGEITLADAIDLTPRIDWRPVGKGFGKDFPDIIARRAQRHFESEAHV